MNEIYYGPVYINKGLHKGRVGMCDNNDVDDTDKEVGIIYFGDPMLVTEYHFIPFEDISHITSHILIKRNQELFNKLTSYKKNPLKGRNRIKYLEEILLIDNLLADRMFKAKFHKGKKSNIFMSYSSKDKQFVRWISVDLNNAGHKVWFDEWNILIGESIPSKIQKGLDECDFLIVILSQNSVISNWVEREWQEKYFEEINKGKIFVLPILKEKCNIPTLLKTKRYADFSGDYTQGLEDLLFTLNKFSNK